MNRLPAASELSPKTLINLCKVAVAHLRKPIVALGSFKRRRVKAARALARARLTLAEQRRDTRSIHDARERLKAATTAQLRAEMG